MPSPSLINPVKQRLRRGQPALGLSVRFSRNPAIIQVAEESGHDFVFIDSQHAAFNLESIAGIAQAALYSDVAALVRVKSVADPDAALLLDGGAAGIVFPDVDTVDDARQAVDICRFAPLGRRSVSGGYPHFRFAAVPAAEALPRLQEHCLLVAMVESPEGLENVDAICAVPGIDVIHFGAYDYAAAIGQPGQVAHPEVKAAQARVIAAATRAGKVAGCAGGRSAAEQVENIRSGARFIVTQSDVGLLLGAARSWVGTVREGAGQPAP